MHQVFYPKPTVATHVEAACTCGARAVARTRRGALSRLSHIDYGTGQAA
jgi:hypothetical protein